MIADEAGEERKNYESFLDKALKQKALDEQLKKEGKQILATTPSTEKYYGGYPQYHVD